ncbi:hypothetical protein EDI_100390 [Entamoeba dispar SAW760]|uniref:Uncharacterized protein n=1 Tax=Entamoeba dispar (strain ATCC PRA-260 / SAW760) TaxID=370354 RepID=B0EKX2_ENTDS|nr:uncharacterized protein EDI_100390 [Entamoeba dispar SAW760]EDR24829.1 hypothetical protein EDI_100390 [Entamoeba dispar SAW760]|eukprot:EDR24829.1 hypothetical protein EDI_100390 [Entamoeba dispar SAW760]
MKSTTSKTSGYSMKELKRSSKSFEAIQQAVLLGILNINGFGFRIKRPERRSQKTLQLMLIEALTKENTLIQFEHEIDKKCTDLVSKELQECGYTDLRPDDIDTISSLPNEKHDLEKLKQIKRHRDANRSSLSFAELLQMCEKIGYVFKKRPTKPAKLTVKMSKICSVSGCVSLGLSEINEIGEAINRNVFERFEKSSSSVDVGAYDEAISIIWKNATEKIVNRNSVVSEPIPNVKEEPFIITEPSLGAMSNLTEFSTSYYPEGSVISAQPPDTSNLSYVHYYSTPLEGINQQPVFMQTNTGMAQQQVLYLNDDMQTYVSTEPNQFTIQQQQQPFQYNQNMTVPILDQQHNQQPPVLFTIYNQNSNQIFGNDECFINQSLPPNGGFFAN